MTMLQQLRKCPRWIVLAVGIAAVAVTSMALLPHDDPDERSCLVCKASHEPFQAFTAVSGPEPPVAATTPTPGFEVALASESVADSSSPRAPPA